MDSLILIAIIAGGALLLLVILFRLAWRVAEPNEALIISGFKTAKEGTGAVELHDSLGFRIITGKGTLVVPGVQTVRRLSLDLRQSDLAIDCVTHQGIPLGIKGVLIYKVGDDFSSIANAARRFLDQQNQMDQRVHNVFAGHLRAIVGNMTVEEMIRDRDKLTSLTRSSAGSEMEKLGLIVDSLQIQEIDDPTGYISNLGRPHAAAVERDARIAQAQADQAATEAEQEADARKAEARRNSAISQAGFQAEVDRAAATSQQAGPLADAAARQQVVVQETKVAELEGQREEQRLQATVRKPADAKAYEQTTLAKVRARRADRRRRSAGEGSRTAGRRERTARQARSRSRRRAGSVAAAADAEHVRLSFAAQADSVRAVGEAEAAATQAKGLAEGEAVRAKGIAEADSIKARADALLQNQDAVIGQQLAENWPAIVEAAAKPFGAIDQLIVLNGAQGVSEVLAQALSQGVAGLQMARTILGKPSRPANGQDAEELPPPKGEV